MRRLRRKAHQKHVREHKKFKQRAIAAGTAVAITLGVGASLSKALATHIPDPHELPVSQDADADLLANGEEFAIGYLPFNPDQNCNEIPDGAELAHRCNSIIEKLPWEGQQTDPNQTYKWHNPVFGIEWCEICAAQINMGPAGIVNPRLGLNISFPLIVLHYIEHGSFSYNGTTHDGRVDVPLLLRVLEVRFPYDPNEHQLPVDGNDFDEDLITDNEELKAGYDLYNADQDANLVPDGIELAKQCCEIIDGLPLYKPGITTICKKENLLRGLEWCDICKTSVNMGTVEIINPKLQLSTEFPFLTLHYMEHGSFSYAGDVHGKGRIDVALLAKILQMPRRCGDLGTIYLPGDVNKDCKVDFKDFAEFADEWLGSTDPNEIKG
jgi:hypothetical protein